MNLSVRVRLGVLTQTHIHMDQTSLGLYIYMNSPEPIIKWLKSEGITKQSGAKAMLSGAVQSLVFESALRAGSSLAGTAGCIPRVLEAFDE